MNTYTVIFGVLLYLAVVNARHYAERSDTESLLDNKEGNTDSAKRREHGQSRHKRRSWQMNYGYEYPQPQVPFGPPSDRRDYETQQNLLPHIYRLLDELSDYIRRPPIQSPPQPIYVPYPVPYPVPQGCNCGSKPNSKPAIENRFPVMDDSNQNWGFVDSNKEDDDDDNDGSRPISFNPIVPSRPMRPAPKLDHGSTQASESPPEPSLAASQSTESGRAPGMCDVFSLSCCNGTPQQQRQCFTKVGCAKTYDNGNGCDKRRLFAIIEAYSKEYSPVN